MEQDIIIRLPERKMRRSIMLWRSIIRQLYHGIIQIQGISNVSFDRSYQRIANILVIDGGTLIGIGFGKLAICIDSENKDHEYVSLFWRG